MTVFITFKAYQSTKFKPIKSVYRHTG